MLRDRGRRVRLANQESRHRPRPDHRSRCFLGGAVAIDLASKRDVAGVVTLLTFTSIEAMVQHHCPGMPTKRLLRHRFASIEKVGKLTCPMLIVHSRQDTWVPESMAKELAHVAERGRR